MYKQTNKKFGLNNGSLTQSMYHSENTKTQTKLPYNFDFYMPCCRNFFKLTTTYFPSIHSAGDKTFEVLGRLQQVTLTRFFKVLFDTQKNN